MIKIRIVKGLILGSLMYLLLLDINGLVLSAPTTKADDFTDHGNGTVTYKITGLMWKVCAEGQTWEGSACKGAYATYTHAQALKITSTFAGHTDWRLPNLNELSTIVAQEKQDPTINTAVFPKSPATWFWTTSVSDNDLYGAWNISFFNGDHHYDSRSEHFAVRLVRGGR